MNALLLVAEEFIKTEKDYVTELKLLQVLFYNPLIRNGILSENQIDLLFGLLDKLVDMHTQIAAPPDAGSTCCITMDAENKYCIPKTLCSYMDDMKETYCEYIKNYECVSKINDILIEKNESYKNFVEEKEHSAMMNGKKMKNLLVLPVQRFPRLLMLCNRMMKKMPSDHPCKNVLSECISRCSDILDYTDYITSKSGSFEKTYEFLIDTWLNHDEPEIFFTYDLVWEGKMVESDGSHRYIFIFDQLIVCCKNNMRPFQIVWTSWTNSVYVFKDDTTLQIHTSEWDDNGDDPYRGLSRCLLPIHDFQVRDLKSAVFRVVNPAQIIKIRHNDKEINRSFVKVELQTKYIETPKMFNFSRGWTCEEGSDHSPIILIEIQHTRHDVTYISKYFSDFHNCVCFIGRTKHDLDVVILLKEIVYENNKNQILGRSTSIGRLYCHNNNNQQTSSPSRRPIRYSSRASLKSYENLGFDIATKQRSNSNASSDQKDLAQWKANSRSSAEEVQLRENFYNTKSSKLNSSPVLSRQLSDTFKNYAPPRVISSPVKICGTNPSNSECQRVSFEVTPPSSPRKCTSTSSPSRAGSFSSRGNAIQYQYKLLVVNPRLSKFKNCNQSDISSCFKSSSSLLTLGKSKSSSGNGLASISKSKIKNIASMIKNVADIDVKDVKSVRLDSKDIQNSLARLDIACLSKNYKVGVVNCKMGQSGKENAIFSNLENNMSPDYKKFLGDIGENIRLNGWHRFNGGLDTRYSPKQKSVWSSLVTGQEEYEFMFHVCEYLPFQKKDEQRIERKRHIGNDIVLIVFLEDETIDPATFVSNFIQVVITVRRVDTGNNDDDQAWYQVDTAYKNGVGFSEPPTKLNTVFRGGDEFRKLMQVKIINSERCVYNTNPAFIALERKTVSQILNDIKTTSDSSN